MLKNKSIILILFLSITLFSCPQSQTITKEPPRLVNIDKKIVLSEGENKKISYETIPSGQKLAFIVNDSNIAEIDSDGNIKAKTKGSTKIITVLNGQIYTIDLEVSSTKTILNPVSSVQIKEDEKICNICGENVKIKKNEFCPNHTCKNDETSNNQIQNQSNQNQIETNSCNICGTIVTIQGTCPSTTCKSDEITSPSIVQSLVPTSTPIQTVGETPNNTQTQEPTTTPTITTSVTALPLSPTIVPTTIQTSQILRFRTIAFIVTNFLTNTGNLFIMNEDTSTIKKLTETPIRNTRSEQLNSLKWSPDGNKIAFISDKNELYVINKDGSNELKLSDGDNNIGLNLNWSTDSRDIIFNTKNSFFKINSDGSFLEKLFDLPQNSSNHVLSPDNNKLIYFINDGRASIQGYYMSNSDDSNRIKLTLPLDGKTWTNFYWSKNSQNIYFQTTYTNSEYRTGDSGVSFKTDLVSLKSDGSNLKHIYSTISDKSSISPPNPAFSISPDGSTIIMVRLKTFDNKYNSVLVNIESGKVTPLLFNSFNVRNLDWSPDDKSISYIGIGNKLMILKDLLSTNATDFSDGNQVSDFEWSPK